jgi:hypothetical protein
MEVTMRFTTSLSAFLLICAAGLSGREFYSDDPLLKEPAPRDASKAKHRKISDYYDFFHQTLGRPGEPAEAGKTTIRAQAVNTLGEPMDGAWYTRRHYYRRMSIEELVRGAGNSNAPATDRKWMVVKAKSEGVTPGFEFLDSKGRRYVLKFDPPDYPELATGPDVVASKFFYALGYHVPENYLVHFTRDQLEVRRGVTLKDAKGRTRWMRESDITALLENVPQDRHNRYRGVASLYLKGKPMGPFKYFGVRKDDPNDIVSHEHRRDLREMRVFAAWLGHDDSRAINSLDVLVNDAGTPHIRHHLIDFGSTLGSASYGPNSPRSGFEYVFEWRSAIWQFVTVGLRPPNWATATYVVYPALGRFEAEKFEPAKWLPEYPNPAFSNMLPDDAFWAAKQVMAFSDEDIRAIVATGEYSDPRVQHSIAESLIKRRDKIGRTFFSAILPLDDFMVWDGRLAFNDLEIQHGIKAERPYKFQWFEFDKDSDRRSAIAGAVSATVPEAQLAFMACQITSDKQSQAVEVYVRRKTGEVVGVARTWE